MVIEGQKRAKKFEQKFDSETMRDRYAQAKDRAIKKAGAGLMKQAQGQSLTRKVLAFFSIGPTFLNSYLMFGDGIDHLKKKYSGQTLLNEASIRLQAMVSRGLSDAILDAILLSRGIRIHVAGKLFKWDEGKWDIDYWG